MSSAPASGGKKEKKFTIQKVTPKAIAAYAWVDNPDTGNQYSDDKFKVTLVFEPDTIDELRAAAQEVAEKGHPGVSPDDITMPFKDGNDKADKNEEFAGKILITAKSKFKPQTMDAKRKALPKSVKIFSGDIVKALIVFLPYESTEKVRNEKTKKLETVKSYGVTAQLKALQLIEKRNGGGDASSAFDDEEGFEAEEGLDQDGSDAAGKDDGSGDY